MPLVDGTLVPARDHTAAELVARAEAGGMKLTGEGGLLAELTRKVLESALEGRRPGFRHHLRRLAHYRTPIKTINRVLPLLHRPRAGIRRSMGRVGFSYDNALAESFFASIKRELLHAERWTHTSEARVAVFSWLARYNNRRRHSALGHVSPVEFECRTISSSNLNLAL